MATLILGLWQRQGGWLTGFLWRLMGWTAVQFALIKFVQPSFSIYLAHHHWSFHVLWVAGGAICIAGFRPILLMVAALASLLCFAEVLSHKTYTLGFPAAEWAMQLPVFLLSLLIVGAAAIRSPRDRASGTVAGQQAIHAEIEWGITRLLRATVVIAMLWAAVHKLNADFLDPETSCVTMLTAQLADWWRLPHDLMFGWLQPVHIIVLEAAVPILLLVAPRAGILLALFVGFIFGSLGATRFAGLMVVMAFAFFDDEDVGFVRAGLRRYRVLIGLTIGAMLILSFMLHAGPRRWFQFGLYHGVLVFLTWCAVFAILRRRMGLQVEEIDAPPIRKPSWFVRFVVGLALALNLVNGLTPYLGIKYQYSFAMLSNLRADAARWNSLVVPRWLRIVDHDPYVRVLSRTVLWPDTLTPDDAPDLIDELERLDTLLMVPREILARLRLFWARDVWVGLLFEYRGKRYDFREISSRIDLRIKMNALPNEPLFQPSLAAEGPQHCRH